VTENIIINQVLAEKFRPLLLDLEKLDLTFSEVSDGAGVNEAWNREIPRLLVLLSRDIDRMADGIDLQKCIVIEEPTAPLEEEQKKQFLKVFQNPVLESDLLEVMLAELRPPVIIDGEEESGEPPEETKRIATRVDISGPIIYVLDEKQKQGWGINASRTGILFCANEEIEEGVNVLLRFDMLDGKSLDLSASVVRCTQLESPEHGCTYSIGAKFVRLRDNERDRLDALMETRSLAMAKQLSPVFLKELFENGEKILIDAFQKEINPAGLAIYLKEVGPFEREAYSNNEGKIYDLIRRLVAHRMQCYAFRIFLPAVRANRRQLVPLIIPLLGKLVSLCDSIEMEVDKTVKAVHDAEAQKNRQQINESSSRLYQAKIKLMTAVRDLISPEGLGTEAEIVQRIITKIRVLQELQSGSSPGVPRYGNRTYSTVTRAPRDVTKTRVPTSSRGATKTMHGKAKSSSPWIGSLIRVLSIAALGGAIMFYFIRTNDQIRVTDLNLGIPVDQVERQDQSILIHTQSLNWRNLPKSDKELVAGKIENVLRDKELNRSTVVDEQGRILLMIEGQETPSGTVFQRNFARRN